MSITSERQERLDAAMARIDRLGPLPGMIAAFELYFGQKWTSPDWRGEASVWAAAWGKAVTPQRGATEALAELVALHDLKAEELRLRQRKDVAIRRDPESLEEVNRMRYEYNVRKPLALAAARSVLAERQA